VWAQVAIVGPADKKFADGNFNFFAGVAAIQQLNGHFHAAPQFRDVVLRCIKK
jgi:hypothetical protein